MQKRGCKVERDGTRTWDPALGILNISRAGGMWCSPTRAVLPGARSSRGAFSIRLFELAPRHSVHIPASSAGRPGGLSEAQRPRVFSWAPGAPCTLCISGSADLDQTLPHHIFPDPPPCRETPKCTESCAQKCFRGFCFGSHLQGSLGTSENVWCRRAAAASSWEGVVGCLPSGCLSFQECPTSSTWRCTRTRVAGTCPCMTRCSCSNLRRKVSSTKSCRFTSRPPSSLGWTPQWTISIGQRHSTGKPLRSTPSCCNITFQSKGPVVRGPNPRGSRT